MRISIPLVLPLAFVLGISSTSVSAAELVPGFSAPALKAAGWFTLQDDFNAGHVNPFLWFVPTTEFNIVPPSVLDGRLRFDTGVVKVGEPFRGSTLEAMGRFAPDSYQVRFDLTVGGESQGVFSFGAALVGQAGFNGPYHSVWLNSSGDGAVYVSLGGRNADGTFVGGQSQHVLLRSGSVLPLSLTYDKAARTLRLQVAGADLVQAGVDYSEALSLKLLSSAAATAGDSRAVFLIDNLSTTLSAPVYKANLTPFQHNGVVYDGSFSGRTPAVIYGSETAAEITADGDPISVWGRENLHVYLITTPPGLLPNGNKVTVISERDETFFTGLRQVASVDAVIPNAFLAQGTGVDYRVNLAGASRPQIEAEMSELGIILAKISGLGNSLNAKFDAIRLAIRTGDTVTARRLMTDLRQQVMAQKGKRISVYQADSVLAILSRLGALI